MKKIIEQVYEGKKAEITMDLIPLTDEQLEEMIKDMSMDELPANENKVFAKVNGKNIEVTEGFNVKLFDGVFYLTHDRKSIQYADLSDWSISEKDYLRKTIERRLKNKNKRLIEDDVVLPLTLSGRIKPKYFK